MTGKQRSDRTVAAACALATTLSLITATHAIEACGSERGGRWISPVGAGAISVTQTEVDDDGEQLSAFGGFKFEYRENEGTVWSFTGNYGCSNGFVYCWLTVPVKDAEYAEYINSRVEWIMEDGEPTYVVFAHLDRLVANAQFHGRQIELKKGMGMEIEMPSYFRLEACDK